MPVGSHRHSAQGLVRFCNCVQTNSEDELEQDRVVNETDRVLYVDIVNLEIRRVCDQSLQSKICEMTLVHKEPVYLTAVATSLPASPADPECIIVTELLV